MFSVTWAALLEKANRAAEAIEPLVAAVGLAPRAINLHQLLGYSLAASKRYEEAESAFRRALVLDPTDANSHCGLGLVQTEASRFEEAEASCREAIRLNPNLVQAYQNLGAVLLELNRPEEALACYQTATKLRPDSVDVHKNLGIALGKIGRHEDSIRAYDRVIALDPESGDGRYNRAMMKLLIGNYLEGFAEYEWRWHCRGFARPNFTQPLWKGESIAGKTILLIPEQGLGDTIQFIRFAPKVKALGATVIFWCYTDLSNLFEAFPGIDVLVPGDKSLPSFDVYVPLINLPVIFRTCLEDVPEIHPVPYLKAHPDLVERWRDRLGPRAAQRASRVGIFWQGNPTNGHDRFRSVRLEAFLPLAAVPGVKLISFQKDHGVEQIAPLAGRIPMLDFRDSTRFEDTAALMSLMDLVVTIDSAPVHLAGALGVPTWLALIDRPRVALARRPRGLALVSHPQDLPTAGDPQLEGRVRAHGRCACRPGGQCEP